MAGEVPGVNTSSRKFRFAYNDPNALIANSQALKPKVNPRKYMVDQLAKEAQALNTDPNSLGLSDAAKRQMTDVAAQQSAVQNANAISGIGRAGLAAGQPFQRQALAEVSQEVSDNSANVAQAQMQAEEMSQQKIAQAQQRVDMGMAAERLTRKQNREFWANYALAGVQTVGESLKTLGGIGQQAGNQGAALETLGAMTG